jgi:hypothetical protein
MKLQILHVPDCPNLAPLEAGLGEALLGRQDVEITRREVSTVEEAVATGMAGSPTLLVDGIDPFATAGRAPSLSCRLYRDTTGRVEGAPSAAALRDVLGLKRC